MVDDKIRVRDWNQCIDLLKLPASQKWEPELLKELEEGGDDDETPTNQPSKIVVEPSPSLPQIWQTYWRRFIDWFANPTFPPIRQPSRAPGSRPVRPIRIGR